MAGLGLVGLVAAVFVAALVAIRRDPRITASELRAQVLWIAAYAAGAGAIAWLTLANGADRAWVLAGAVTLAAWLVVALPLLARHLARRLNGPER